VCPGVNVGKVQNLGLTVLAVVTHFNPQIAC
jgi:hypothetical protein